jgi:hypothetical protein
MAPWTSAVAYRLGEKFSGLRTTHVKLGTSGLWVGTWTEAGVTATLV